MKSQDVLFSENQLCSLSMWDLLRLIPWGFWCEIFTRHVIVCIEFWLRFEHEIRITRFAINVLFIIVRAEREVRLCETV